ncbi:MAG: TetR/AcrR family transcriptional regulator [Nitriliruptorales bacterium]
MLEDAAVRLFLERGYDRTTVADIAAAAGVTERTFFHHFPSKDAVVFPDQGEILALLLSAIHEHVTADRGLPGLCDALEDLFGRLEPQRARVLQRAELRRSNPDLDQSLRRSVAEWASPIASTLAEASGRETPELPDRLLAHLAVFAAFEIIENARREPSRPLGDIARATCERSLRTLQGG